MYSIKMRITKEVMKKRLFGVWVTCCVIFGIFEGIVLSTNESITFGLFTTLFALLIIVVGISSFIAFWILLLTSPVSMGRKCLFLILTSSIAFITLVFPMAFDIDSTLQNNISELGATNENWRVEDMLEMGVLVFLTLSPFCVLLIEVVILFTNWRSSEKTGSSRIKTFQTKFARIIPVKSLRNLFSTGISDSTLRLIIALFLSFLALAVIIFSISPVRTRSVFDSCYEKCVKNTEYSSSECIVLCKN